MGRMALCHFILNLSFLAVFSFFFTHGCCEAASVSLCGYLSVGQLNNGNDQPAWRALFACESGLSEPEIGLEHEFVLNDKIRTVPVCKNNCKLL
jgi:hypothetical protein